MKKMMLMSATLAIVGAGCIHAPYWQSLDRHNFVSTPHQPVTLTLVDTYTGETVWKLDIPIYKMAVVDLDHDEHWTTNQTPALPATQIRWGIFDAGKKLGLLDNKQPLSGNPVLLKWSIREGKEDYTPPNEEKAKADREGKGEKADSAPAQEKRAESRPSAG